MFLAGDPRVFPSHLLSLIVGSEGRGIERKEGVWKKRFLGRSSVGREISCVRFPRGCLDRVRAGDVDYVGIRLASKEWASLYLFFFSLRACNDRSFDAGGMVRDGLWYGV